MPAAELQALEIRRQELNSGGNGVVDTLQSLTGRNWIAGLIGQRAKNIRMWAVHAAHPAFEGSYTRVVAWQPS